MKYGIYVILFLTLMGCAKATPDETQVEAPKYSIAEIPTGCTKTNPGYGVHQFPSGAVLQATELDCGIREGKQCYYYVHLQGWAIIEDVRCY